MPKKIIDLGSCCLDIQQASSSNGTPILIWDQKSSDNNNQLWNFTNDGYIESYMFPNKCLDTETGLVSIGTKIVLMDKNGANHQKWDFDRITGMITSRLDSDMCIARAIRKSDRTIIKGSSVYLWNKNSPNFLLDEWKWNLIDVPQAPVIINLSYKIFAHPITGEFPKPEMIANIHFAVQDMNLFCNSLNTNFRFRLLEEPVLIGGSNASGHANFWFNTNLQIGGHLNELDTMARSFLNADYPFDQTNAFAWRANAVNIFLSGIGYGGVSLFPGIGDSVGLAIDTDRTGMTIQIHELGHFFGLPHTHDSNGMFADILIDNKDFKNPEEIAQANYHKPLSNLSPEEAQLVENTWSNIMSYHGSNTHPLNILTANQLERWDSVMRNARSGVITV
jgi:hypothetical protein